MVTDREQWDKHPVYQFFLDLPDEEAWDIVCPPPKDRRRPTKKRPEVLKRWWVELSKKKRTVHTYDALWRAACVEMHRQSLPPEEKKPAEKKPTHSRHTRIRTQKNK